MARELEKNGSGVVATWAARLASIDREVGMNNGTLRPRDVVHAGPVVKRVIEALYAELGRRELKLADVNRALPKVLAALAERALQYGDDSLMPVAQGTVMAVVSSLSASYRDEVLLKRTPLTQWHEQQKVGFQLWKRLSDLVPAAFPPVSKKLQGGSAGLDVISALYKDLQANRLNTSSFYARAGITDAELLMLQAADPDRFPRDGDTPFWRTFRGHREPVAKKEIIEDVSTGNGRWGGRGFTLGQAAEAIGARATQLFEKNVLLTVPELIAQLNADTKLVAKYGVITRPRYEASRALDPSRFPNPKNMDFVLPRLARAVGRVMEAKPGLSPSELVTEMKRQYPSFKLTRIYQLRERYPDLIPRAQAERTPESTRRADALELKALLERDPAPTMAEAAAAMKSKSRPYVTVAYLTALKKTFADEVFAATYAPRTRQRSHLGWAKTLELVERLMPPGAREPDLMAALNRLLEARGLPPFEGKQVPVNLAGKIRGREDLNALVTSEVVAEYLRAAPRGATLDEVSKTLFAEYPTLDATKLGLYQKLWREQPKQYPALLGLKLTGQGETVEKPRYLGGWDFERALLEPAKTDPELATELARLSQHTRIVTSLPLLDALVSQLNGSQPLKNCNVLWVTHMLGTTMAQSEAMRAAGMAASKTIIVGSPYGTNDVVKSVLVDDGFDARVPAMDVDAYKQAVLQGLLDTAKRCRKNHEPVVVLDDGGQVTQILNEDPRFEDVRSLFKVVEQTTRGITNSEAKALKVPLISVATSKSKAVEGELVGRSVAQKVLQGLERSGKPVKGLEVTLVGYGVVGSQVCAALKEAGAKVTVVENTPARAAEAKAAGFAVTAKAQALKKCDVVIGATGHRSLEVEDLKLLRDGAAFVSASSKQVEADMVGLKAKAKAMKTLDPGAPLVHLPNVEYTLGGKTLLALGDGWPINFDGDVEDISAEEIQVTRCAMFLGALQASRMNRHDATKDRFIPLDPAADEALYAAYRAFQKKHPPSREIGDPAKWADVLRAVAKTAGLA
ncbi:MAG: NAD-binding protein [Myxococcaceae bacterium]|nr:NAD-binding protein [Myxococcaceae bacterium]